MSRLAAFRSDDAQVTADLEEFRPAFEAAWAREVKRLARVAVQNLHRHQPIVAAGEPPDWSMPNEDEVLPIAQQRALVAAAMRREFAAMHKILLQTGESAGLSFEVRNRIVDEVLAERGQHITKITETIRSEIMTQLREAYTEGESLRQASRRVATTLGERSTKRAQVIAATELAGAKNGASVRLASVMNNTSLNSDGSVRHDTLGHDPIKLLKSWYATMDHRTRPTHAQANGQTVPITQPFSVGGSSLMYPGDPSGPGDEVIHCRCTVTYTEAA